MINLGVKKSNLSIAFYFLPLYNNGRKAKTWEKLIYYNTHLGKSQAQKKGSTKMDDADGEGEALRAMVVEAVERCTDVALLDLIYKLLA